MGNEELHFKFTTNCTTKNLIEVNKVVNKKLYFIGCLSVFILLAFTAYRFINRRMDIYDISFVEGLIMYFKFIPHQIVNIFVFLLYWKLPEISTWINLYIFNKDKISKDGTITYSFYDTYFTKLSSEDYSHENYEKSVVTIRYPYVYKVYISKNLYIIIDYSGGVNSFSKNSFDKGNEQDFLIFINNTFKDKLNILNTNNKTT